MSERRGLEELRDRALEDLRALAGQIAAGEIGPETAARLERRYEAQAAGAIGSLDRLIERNDDAITISRRPRSRRRVAAGITAAALTVGFAVIGLINAVEPRPAGGFATGGVVSDAADGVELASITNEEMEAVVAANPDITPMRLALARRYVEAGDFSAALGHYLYILEREDNSEALMYVGWMTYLSGEATTAVALLERSLEIDPGEPVAQWFLANALFYGTGDRAEAVPLLEAVIAAPSVPPEVVEAATEMLAEVGGS